MKVSTASYDHGMPDESDYLTPLGVTCLGETSFIHMDLSGNILRDRVESDLLYRRDDAVPLALSHRSACARGLPLSPTKSRQAPLVHRKRVQ